MIDSKSEYWYDIVTVNVKLIIVKYKVLLGDYKRIVYKINDELIPSSFYGTLDELEEELIKRYKNLFPLYDIKLVGIDLNKNN